MSPIERAVREFHEKFDCGIAETPRLPRVSDTVNLILQRGVMELHQLAWLMMQAAASERGEESHLLLIRLQLLLEELAELAEALREGDVEAALHELVDLLYVVEGTFLSLGLWEVKEQALLEIHRSNMTKLVDGRPALNEAGRVVKGPDYQKPDLKKILEEL